MDPFLITVSRVQSMRSFFNVVFRGRSALCGRVMVAGDANLDPRDKIACNISQLLIFNAVMGEHGRDKNRSGLTKTMVSRYRMLVSWK